MLKYLWEEICWKADDVKYWFEDRGHDIACELRGLRMKFDAAVWDVQYRLENIYWDIREGAPDLKMRLQGRERDGSIQIAKGVFLYEAEKQPKPSAEDIKAEKRRKAGEIVIDAEYTEVTTPAP